MIVSYAVINIFACDSIATVTRLACTSVRAASIGANGVRTTIIAILAFVDVLAIRAIALVTALASTAEGASSVGAHSIVATNIRGALIDV